MTCTVEYLRDNEWKPSFTMGNSPRTASEAERLASIRSEHSGFDYRVVDADGISLSVWRNGNQVGVKG